MVDFKAGDTVLHKHSPGYGKGTVTSSPVGKPAGCHVYWQAKGLTNEWVSDLLLSQTKEDEPRITLSDIRLGDTIREVTVKTWINKSHSRTIESSKTQYFLVNRPVKTFKDGTILKRTEKSPYLTGEERYLVYNNHLVKLPTGKAPGANTEVFAFSDPYIIDQFEEVIE